MSDTPRMNAARSSNDRYRIGCDLERELSAIKSAVAKRDEVIAYLLEHVSAIANGECPDWIDGEEPNECPDHECIKCWESWIKEQLK